MSLDELRDEVDEHQEDIEQVEPEAVDDEQDIDDTEPDSEPDEQDDNQDDDPADELGFSFDDDGEDKDPFAGQAAPEWVKQVREENRELKRQLKQRESQPEHQALREKPTLDAHDYDSDAFEQDYAQWLSEKQEHDAAIQAEQQKYKHYDESYKSSVDALRAKAPDYDDIEQSIVDTMPVQRQAIIKMMVDDPARMVYALGKSPSKQQALSKLDDMQFAKQIVLMEQQMSSKTKSRNPNKPKPKTHELEGAAGGADTRLAKLEAEADRTGDRSKVAAYKKQLKSKG